VLVYLPFLLHFAPFSYHFISFVSLPSTNCLQISLFTDLLEGVLSYNPPVCKSAFLAFNHFLIEPPPSLQHCPQQPPETNRHSNRNISSNNRATSFPSCREEFGTPQLWLLLILRPWHPPRPAAPGPAMGTLQGNTPTYPLDP